MDVKISCKSVAKRRNTIQSITYHYETPIATIKDFLVETVKINVAEYESRQECSEILKVLSKEEIEDKSTTGKIDFDRVNTERKPNLDKAITTALECFEDGLIIIFVDGNRAEHLEDPITMYNGIEVTFVRMTMLAGRMW